MWTDMYTTVETQPTLTEGLTVVLFNLWIRNIINEVSTQPDKTEGLLSYPILYSIFVRYLYFFIWKKPRTKTDVNGESKVPSIRSIASQHFYPQYIGLITGLITPTNTTLACPRNLISVHGLGLCWKIRPTNHQMLVVQNLVWECLKGYSCVFQIVQLTISTFF